MPIASSRLVLHQCKNQLNLQQRNHSIKLNRNQHSARKHSIKNLHLHLRLHFRLLLLALQWLHPQRQSRLPR